MSTTAVLIAILGAGGLGYLGQLGRWLYTRRQQSRPDRVAAEKIHASVAQADESVIVVARARDQLAQDNARLRMEIEETSKRHGLERAEWAAERAELRREIDDMEERLRAALAEVHNLKVRHNMVDPPPAPPASKGGRSVRGN